METVMIRHCEEYDRDRIGAIVTEGMQELGYDPAGKLFVKPNVVFAFDRERYGSHAYTHPEILGASLQALLKGDPVHRIDVGENTAMGMPTRLVYKYAGYHDEIRRVRSQTSCPVNLYCIDEELRDSVFIGGRVHDNLRVSRPMARADGKIYLPKLKCHCVSNMTGAVKLNIGICSDDERAIRHDFLLNEKIVDLLSAGWPDFIVMDAIEVGVGNEAVPTPRKLGLILMGRNPIAVDLVAARLLGFHRDDIPYLKAAVDRGYYPANIEEVKLAGDITRLDALDEQAARILPYDDEFKCWQDVTKELERLRSPIRFFWGPYGQQGGGKCLTGCVMGLKMFLAFFEKYAGAKAFAEAKPVTFVIGQPAGTIDAQGHEVFIIGSCAGADIVNAKKIIRIDKCFTTASDMMQRISFRLGMPSPFLDPSFLFPYVGNLFRAAIRKLVSGRYLQDVAHFLTKRLTQRV